MNEFDANVSMNFRSCVFVILKNMKMKCFLLFLYFAPNFCQEIPAENEQDVKRGTYPFLAFIYYSDPSVVDISGQRFVRSAVLIRAEWLVTTAIGPSLMDPPDGFPKKTLLARAGAISINANFSLNEDEDEQEREIVQIIRPYNHSATQWWRTDISLMKTLLPFNMTSAVEIRSLNYKPPDFMDIKTCSILVYAKKYSNSSEDKSLMMLYVDLLQPSINNCGSLFTEGTMICASDSNENKDALYVPDFCQGNSGGPLLCNNEVVALQTYVGNDCKQPHLYQLLYPWDNFITCGIEDKCQEEQCGSICDVIYKDLPVKDQPKNEVNNTLSVTQDTAREIIQFLNVPTTSADKTTTEEFISFPSPNPTAITTTDMAAITTFSEFPNDVTLTVNISDVTEIKETDATTPETTTNTVDSTFSEHTITENEEKLTAIDQSSSWSKPKNTLAMATDSDNEVSETTQESVQMSMIKKRVWPKEKSTYDKNENDKVDRKTEVEAQQAPVKRTVKKRSSANRHLSGIQHVFFGFTVIMFII